MRQLYTADPPHIGGQHPAGSDCRPLKVSERAVSIQLLTSPSFDIFRHLLMCSEPDTRARFHMQDQLLEPGDPGTVTGYMGVHSQNEQAAFGVSHIEFRLKSLVH